MSSFNKVGGRYGMHSGSARFKNLQIDSNLWLQGNALSVNPGKTWYVDGDVNASGTGDSWGSAFKTIQEGVTAASADDIVYVAAQKITDYTGDPTSYEENVIIPFANAGMALIGVSRGRTQGGLPQLKVGTTTTQALLTIRAPGCLIANMGFNGAGATGGGILLDDDYTTKAAFGTTITGCHFKNCVGPDADDAKDGGAIQWSAQGNAWQVSIIENRFYKNVCDICLLGTESTRPQDVLIEGNQFSGYAAYTDCNIQGTGTGSGFGSINIINNVFGQLPAIGANVARYIDLTGTLSGMVVDNVFGCQTNETGGTVLTFKADGTAAKIPTTVHVARNYGQSINFTESGEIKIE